MFKPWPPLLGPGEELLWIEKEKPTWRWHGLLMIVSTTVYLMATASYSGRAFPEALWELVGPCLMFLGLWKIVEIIYRAIFQKELGATDNGMAITNQRVFLSKRRTVPLTNILEATAKGDQVWICSQGRGHYLGPVKNPEGVATIMNAALARHPQTEAEVHAYV